MKIYDKRQAVEMLNRLAAIRKTKITDGARFLKRIPLFVFGKQGTGKKRYLRDHGAKSPHSFPMQTSTPNAINRHLNWMLSQAENNMYYEDFKSKHWIIQLEGYDLSDRRFNELLYKFAESGFEIFITSQDSFFKAVPKSVRDWALEHFLVIQTGFPEYDHIVHNQAGGTRHLLNGEFEPFTNLSL